MSKYLLTGGSGVLGAELRKHLDCFAPNRKELNICWQPEDMINELYTHFDVSKCNGIIHCAAFTDVPGAEVHKRDAIMANIMGTEHIMHLGHFWKVPVVYISTDYVYPGITGNYLETDKTEAFNFYGFTKLAGEAFATPNDLVIRTSFKPVDLWMIKYKKAFNDVYTSADYVDVIAKDIAFSIHSGLKGVYNIGTERKSIYDLAKQVNLAVEPISRLSISDVKLPSDISMNVDKYLTFKDTHIKEFETFVGDK